MASGPYMGFFGYLHVLIGHRVITLAQTCVLIQEILSEKLDFICYHVTNYLIQFNKY